MSYWLKNFYFFFRYLLDNKWFNQCTVYLGFDEGGGGKDEDGGADANPGPIDNKAREHSIDYTHLIRGIYYAK